MGGLLSQLRRLVGRRLGVVLRSLLDLGITEEHSAAEAHRIHIANGISVMNIGICLSLALQYSITGYFDFVEVLLGDALCWVVTLSLSAAGLTLLARVSVTFAYPVNILLWQGILGRDSGTPNLLFACVALSCLLFTLQEWKLWTLGSSVAVAGFLWGEKLVRPFFPNPMTDFALELHTFEVSTLFTSAQLLVIGFLFAFEWNRTFRQLTEKSAALETAKERALEAAESKAQLLAVMSHELRTPLNGVVGMAQLLQAAAGLNAEQREQLNTLESSAQYLAHLINDTLDLSRLDSGKFQANNDDFELYAVLCAVSSLLESHAERNHTTLTLRREPGCPAYVVGDESRIQQVLLNLVGNSVKFTEHGTVSITARAVAPPKDKRFELELVIEDTGIGMDEGAVARLFHPYAQADASIARRFGGTGLGLAISHRIIVLLGGSIEVTSEPAKGSRFVVRLPLEVGSAPASEPTSDRQDLDLDVLVVDDNDVNLKVAGKFLEKMGCRHEVASNGEQAIERLQHTSFDIVLMDIQMPILDGLAATRVIRSSGESYADIPIVAVTANAFPEDQAKAIDAGMNGYVSKPLVRTELKRQLRKLVSQPERARRAAVAG